MQMKNRLTKVFKILWSVYFLDRYAADEAGNPGIV